MSMKHIGIILNFIMDTLYVVLGIVSLIESVLIVRYSEQPLIYTAFCAIILVMFGLAWIGTGVTIWIRDFKEIRDK